MTGVRDLFTGEPALVPGALRGFRTWRDLSRDGRLRSTGIEHYHWRPARYSANGVPEQAMCLSHAAAYRDHEAPHSECTCGLYGWYAPDDSRIPLAGCTGPIFGVVQATGRVILGTHGFRAEKLEVLGVTCADPAVRERLREFGYPVHNNREDMLAAFPQEDVSGLVQHECDGRCQQRAVDGSAAAFIVQFQASLQQYATRMQRVQASAAQAARVFLDAARAIRAEADRIAAEAEEDERQCRQADPRTRALELRRNRSTGPGGPSLFRAALRQRRG